jgi:ribosomal protein S18 acetylase RimI-like enzyme
MSEPIVERLHEAADLDGVIDVEAASFFRPTSREWYTKELQRPDVCYIYVVRTAEVPVAGFCAFWRIADQIHINNLAIASASCSTRLSSVRPSPRPRSSGRMARLLMWI